MKKRFVTFDQAVPVPGQPTKPCSDCPFARKAIPGWLGPASAQQWVMLLHGEARIDCHALIGPQCAGAAIYRANVMKMPRDKSLLQLEKDTELVFAWPDEFVQHHTRGKKRRRSR